MKKIIILALLLSLGISHSSQGEVFHVSDIMTLQDALTTAQSNGEDDTINIASGDYVISNTLTYATSENFALTIIGEGVGSTNLDGGGSYQILNIRTTSGVTDYNAHITLESITLRAGSTSGNGGALSIFTNAAVVSVDNTEFLDNAASYGGAAYIIATYGDVYLFNNTFSGNDAINYYGGAVLGSMTGDVIFDKNLFTGNTSKNYGGAYLVAFSGNIDFTRNIFINNSATQSYGGLGLDASAGHILFTNNIVSGNDAYDEGGALISTDSGTVAVTNNTISGNTAQNDKGGLHIDLGSGTATANIYNNILWGNTSPGVGDLFIGDLDAVVNLNNNDLIDYIITDGANFFESNNINEDPSLDIDLHLQVGSPCIDAGDNNAPEIPLTDLDGNDRIIDGNFDGTADVDMGAHEYIEQNIAVNPTSIDFGDVGVGDGSATSSMTIENNGSADLIVSDITVTGDDLADFTIDLNRSSGPAMNLPETIQPGDSVTLVVVFSPSSMGDKNASLEINSNDPDDSLVAVALTGNGAGIQDIAVDPISINFGEINKGESSSPKVVTIENQGGGDLTISGVTITGDNADDFTIDVDGGSNPLGEVSAVISSGGDATITITFSPSSAGEKSASLEITSDDPDEEVVIIALKGNGKEDGGGCVLSSSKKKRR